MKTSNYKSGKNTISKYYLLLVLATSIGFAQTEKPTQETSKAKSDLSSTSAQHNPYFKNNANQGEMIQFLETILILLKFLVKESQKKMVRITKILFLKKVQFQMF